MAKESALCQWVDLRTALRTFVENVEGHQGSRHIRSLHWYVACRLVIEGGFHPDEITPRPPFEVTRTRNQLHLRHVSESAGSGERTLLGGLKTKDVDVVVTKDGIGPVIAVSMKGTLNAFRNLTNRMEEAVGDCTNLHLAYPTLVYGFLQVLRANREGPGVVANDVAIMSSSEVTDAIRRYHDVLARLADRFDVRDDASKYEAIGLALVDPHPDRAGEVLEHFPNNASPLRLADFFTKLYGQYDQRFVFAAPRLSRATRRLEWSEESPALGDPRIAGYEPRIGEK